MSFAKCITTNLIGKYSQKPFDLVKQSATDALKTTLKKAIQKTAGATGDLIGNEISGNITKVSKTSQQNNLETVESEIKMP